MASQLSLFLRNALRSASRTTSTNRSPHHLRTLCTGTDGGEAVDGEKTPAASSDGRDASSFDPLTAGSRKVPVYGKLTGTGRNTLKSDIILFFEGLNLTLEDVKVEYNRAYDPTGMVLRFPSRSAYDSAVRISTKGGRRLYKLETVDSNHWDLTESYNGKSVVLQGLPQNAFPEDIERFLCGCNFDASNMKVFLRNYPDPSKVAIVQFSSQTEATHALRMKNHNFCLNNPVQMHLLQ